VVITGQKARGRSETAGWTYLLHTEGIWRAGENRAGKEVRNLSRINLTYRSDYEIPREVLGCFLEVGTGVKTWVEVEEEM
jgi:hypothetical protein